MATTPFITGDSKDYKCMSCYFGEPRNNTSKKIRRERRIVRRIERRRKVQEKRRKRREGVEYYEEKDAITYGKKFGYRCKNENCKYKGGSRSAVVCPSCGIKGPFEKL